jgi:hypothetical protein
MPFGALTRPMTAQSALSRGPLTPPKRKIRPANMATRDAGAEGEGWRNILLDQLRQRGANFYGV